MNVGEGQKMSIFNCFGAKFQTTFVVCFKKKKKRRKYRFERSLYVKLKDCTSNSVDSDGTAHIMSRLIWIYAVCKSLLLSPVAVKELKK